ncbi:YceD family protein [Corynebacterium uberis]|uniref:YceD family protein n=1 Tax=Corynebacterium TaxID=1716 RepID=UPI001D0A63D5|nr:MULTISPECIES: YceD family protein [Corynebacterium]MCZ9308380.1 YceD family protein [Corynebacterium sp. c6VSa_13]UDL74051.1 YceD family protein [Corynebacterium uberis]UDL75065.1 YceD family protein [Corynebacterium uberis]UDL77278.1 YceD family protein [Corynebacterium uberis]UDL79562.1 YceD family protein [Corynebacterium uberis]
MTSPFEFDVTGLTHPGAIAEDRRNEGPSPRRIGAAMIAIPEGAPVTVDAHLTPLGQAVMVDAEVSARLEGQCVRCLQPLTPQESFHITEVFSADASLITSDSADDDADDADDAALITDGRVDILQAVTDEVGLTLPFNPTCPDGCADDSDSAPAPDGESGRDEDTLADPRWAGLEKFL